MDLEDYCTATQAAEVLGIRPSTFRAYVSRGEAPKPVAHVDRRTPLWDRDAIVAMKKEGRRGRHDS